MKDQICIDTKKNVKDSTDRFRDFSMNSIKKIKSFRIRTNFSSSMKINWRCFLKS